MAASRARPNTVFAALIAVASRALGRGRADQPRRRRLLALQLRHDRLAQGGVHLHHDMAAARPVRQAAPRPQRVRRVLLGGQALLRLRPGQRALLPAAVGRNDRALADRPRRRSSRRSTSYQPTCSTACRRATRPCCMAEQTGATPPRCGSASRPASRCPATSSAAGWRASASRSSTASAPPRSSTSSSRTGRRSRAGSTGQIVPGYEAKIIDDDGKPCPQARSARSSSRATASPPYWNKHERTKATFWASGFNTHDKFLRTSDGYFWYRGRTDDMIKVSGQAVWPATWRGADQAPGRARKRRGGNEDDDGLIKPRAFVVLKDGSSHDGSGPTSCRSSSRRRCAGTSTRAGSCSSRSCRRRPPARSSATG